MNTGKLISTTQRRTPIVQQLHVAHKQAMGQSGAVFVFFVGVLVVLLLVTALAVDVGNLYRAQIALQKSTDAAALGGLGYTTRQGKFGVEQELTANGISWEDADERDEKIGEFLLPKARQTAWSVMGLNGLPHTPDTYYTIDVTASYNSVRPEDVTDVTNSFRVETERRINFFLLDMLPGLGAGPFHTIRSVAVAERRAARIVLLVDVSNSMNCPSNGSCECLMVPGSNACELPHKIDSMIEAVKVFVKMFDPARDQLYLVPFNVRGSVFQLSQYMTDVMGLTDLDQLTEADIDLAIDAIRADSEPQSATNFCDAMMRATDALVDDGVYGNEDVSYVIFSDGAPTAGRWQFANPKAALPPWNQGEPGAVYDYTAWTVEWSNPSNPSERYHGPSILVQTDLLSMDFEGPQPPLPGSGKDDAGQASAAGWADCSVNTPNFPLFPIRNANMLGGVATSTFSQCLNDFSATVPQSGSVYGTEYQGASGTRSFADWREQYFNCALAISDQWRLDRGHVYTIGLGPAAGFPNYPGKNSLDPYQDVNDVSSRHDIFNTRLAGDVIRGVELPNPPHPDFDYSGGSTYDDISASGRPGTYLATPNANELDRLFQEIAQQILLRLTE